MTPIESGRSGSLLEARWLFWAIALFAVAVFATTNLPWHLDDYDQAKQAFTSFEMVKQGHWFYQHTPRERLATKPPLVGWISAGLYEATRSWDVAWRAPSFLAALAIGLLLARAANDAFGAGPSLIAVAAFGLNLLSSRLATLVRTDMPLAFIVFAVGALIWRHVHWLRPWQRRDRWMLFLLLTAGTLTKGPVVYVFLLPGLLGYWWWRRKTEPNFAWPGRWPWIASFLVFMVWICAGIRWVPGFYDQVIGHEFLGRLGTTEHRPQWFYFYLPHLLQKFAPWSVLILGLGWLQWRRRRDQKMEPGMAWLIWWILGGLVIMSFIPSKRVDRIYPIIAPLCLLIAQQISAPWPNEMRRSIRRFAMLALVLAVLYTGAYGTFKATHGFQHHTDALVEFGKTVRQWAAADDWRTAAIYGGDEGMILYLDQPAFMEKDAAISEWTAEKLEALVVPARDAQVYTDLLQPRPVSFLRSRPRGDGKPDYVLLERRE